MDMKTIKKTFTGAVVITGLLVTGFFQNCSKSKMDDSSSREPASIVETEQASELDSLSADISQLNVRCDNQRHLEVYQRYMLVSHKNKYLLKCVSGSDEFTCYGSGCGRYGLKDLGDKSAQKDSGKTIDVSETIENVKRSQAFRCNGSGVLEQAHRISSVFGGASQRDVFYPTTITQRGVGVLETSTDYSASLVGASSDRIFAPCFIVD